MKWWTRLLAVMLVVLCLSRGDALADHAVRVSFLQQYRGAASAANTKYGKYTSGYWDKALAEKYDGLAVAQNPDGFTRHLSNRGCRLFAFAHAVQLLTGEKASADRQLEILAEFLMADDDPPNAKEVYAAYLLRAYGAEHGIRQVTVAQSWSAVQDHFDQGGVIVFNSGGHIALAADYTERTINGKTEQLILLVDSASEATARRVVSGVCYSGDFSKIYVKSKNVKPVWNDYGRLWIRYSDFAAGTWQACFTSETAKRLAARKVEQIDETLRIAVVTAQEGCPILSTPYDTASVLRRAENGEGIRCTGAAADKAGTIWYCTEDGHYLRAEDVAVYAYANLCTAEGLFTAQGAERKTAPSDEAPAIGAAGNSMTAKRFVTASNGDIWALLADGSYVRFYDLSDDRTELTFTGLTAGFTLTGVQAPTGNLAKGARFPLRGVIAAGAPILSVEAAVINRETALPAMPPAKAQPDAYTTSVNINADVNGTNINSSLAFGTLSKGWYAYAVDIQLGFEYQGRTILLGGAESVIRTEFTVGSPEGEPAAPRLPGDADEDGFVTLEDAVRMLCYGAGESVSINLANADVNDDGAADVHDALRILQYVAGWNVTLL